MKLLFRRRPALKPEDVIIIRPLPDKSGHWPCGCVTSTLGDFISRCPTHNQQEYLYQEDSQ